MRNLTCCCCGASAPAKEQWWNRDTGYGLCGICAQMIQQRSDYDPEEFRLCYGVEDVNWIAVSDKATV
jgi:hypothetical protein